jgi:hypothetical protein
MPSQIKDIPLQQWAWYLKEKMEIAHRFVRENSFGSMLRQKSLHDTKLNWNTFKPGDVYVYFPRYAVGKSPKLTQFWRGPFCVKDKLSDLNYRVNCGPYGKFQLIHLDRMKPKRPQFLQGEGCRSYDQAMADHIVEEQNINDRQDNDELSDRLNESNKHELSGGLGSDGNLNISLIILLNFRILHMNYVLLAKTYTYGYAI